MNRKEVVRQEKYFMEKYITAHKRGDDKTKADVMKHIQKNVNQRRDAR